MNLSSTHRTFFLSVFAICVSATTVNAQTPTNPPPNLQQDVQFQRSSQLLGIPTSYCGHVMDLMMHNRIRQQTGNVGTPEIHLPHLTVGTPTGDLCICGVHLVAPATDCDGPVFQVILHNNSTVAIGNFSVTIVGVLGHITPVSPTAEQTVSRMEPGQETCVQLQLPITCQNMGSVHQPCAFDTLVIAVDSRDCLIENNELNNVQVLSLKTISTVVIEQPPVDLQPPGVRSAVPPEPSRGIRMAPGERNPLDNSSLDQPDPSQLNPSQLNPSQRNPGQPGVARGSSDLQFP